MEKRTNSIVKALFLCLCGLLFISQGNIMAQIKSSEYLKNWPNWRGPQETGFYQYGNPPVEFSETKNIKWKLDIPGKGHSTPVIWGDQLIITTAVAVGKEAEEPKEAEAAQGRRGMSSNKTDQVHKFIVMSIDRNTGSILWQTIVREELPQESTHDLGSWASNSPVTDGKNIYAYFGSRGLFCLDFDGNILWERDFGQLNKRMSFGEGSSPALRDNKIIVLWDDEGQSFIVAIDTKTGKDVWKVDRDEITTWGSPLIVDAGGKTQVITNGTTKIRSYDFENGKIIWETTGMTVNVIPNPIYADGILHLMSGFRGFALRAIDLAKAKGDITNTDAVLWKYDQDTPYTPCPLVMDGKLYFLRINNGYLTCLDARDGKINYAKQKLEGINAIYSSPIGVNGKIYIAATETVLVVKAGAEYELLFTNKLDDTFHASPVVNGNDLFLRGFKSLYCISEE
ncbi:PQQ-binding-like beta-propeller repeat protein [Bacteroidota bacterium]